MGIELPAELADVAAKAGVQWPQADEEAMRTSATAWRQAGSKITALTKDADGTANQALSAVSGTAGTAAQQHWQTFVAPDTGHLTSTAQGCTAAADRLDHAADQVGAAKVQIVSHLVNLAKNTDAADAAAASGHPTALAGLTTAVSGTASSVAQVNHSLTNSIRLDNSPAGHTPDQSGGLLGVAPLGQAGPPVDFGPLGTTGQHGSTAPQGDHGLLGDHGALSSDGPLGQAAPLGEHGVLSSGGPLGQAAPLGDHGALSSAGPLGDHGALSSDGPLGQAAPLGRHGVATSGGPLGPAAPLGDHGVLSGTGPSGDHGGPGPGGSGGLLGGQGSPLGGHGGSGPGGPLGDPGSGGPGPAVPVGVDAGHTGPITINPVAPGHGGFVGVPQVGGHGDIHGVPTPPMGTTVASAAAPAMAPPPTATPGPFDAGSAAAPFAPQPGPGAPTPAFGTPAPAFGGAAPPPPPVAPPPMAAAPPPVAGPVAGGGPVGAPVAARGSANAGVVGAVDVPGRAERSAATPPPRSGNAAALPGMPRQGRSDPRRDAVALFLVYLFPIGQLPKASSRPVRQLPPPAADADFAAGLRFAPHDHPESDLVEPDIVDSTPPHHGFVAADPEVAELADGHDPLGGGHEKDWDHRFLVRAADDGHRAEYAWPPGELFPEGGEAAGEPVVLAEDTVVDRFGPPDGRVFGEDGTPFAQRSLPPDHLDAGYRRYRVVRPLPVWRSVSAAWFGQPGGGVRYRAVYPAADLVAMGCLSEITGTDHGH